MPSPWRISEDDYEVKLAVVSHSLVAERQSWFFDYLGRGGGVEVMQVSPDRWGRYVSLKGYPIIPGAMTDYEFGEEAFRAVEEFRPDVIYVQQEAYCKVTAQFLRFAKRTGARLALFVWENIHEYDRYAANVLRDCDLVVCGNGRAEGLVKPHNERTFRCIQVGVNTRIFCPTSEAVYDVVFQGRMVAEKGYRVLQRAAKGLRGFSVLWPEPEQGSAYVDLVQRYNSAKVHASPSLDTPVWREQHAGYANLEALSCGLYVATSDSVAIKEALDGCPGVGFARQGDHEALRMTIEGEAADYDAYGRNMAGREWVDRTYGYEAVAKALLPALEGLV